jgi:hypothetical protein
LLACATAVLAAVGLTLYVVGVGGSDRPAKAAPYSRARRRPPATGRHPSDEARVGALRRSPCGGARCSRGPGG